MAVLKTFTQVTPRTVFFFLTFFCIPLFLLLSPSSTVIFASSVFCLLLFPVFFCFLFLLLSTVFLFFNFSFFFSFCLLLSGGHQPPEGGLHAPCGGHWP